MNFRNKLLLSAVAVSVSACSVPGLGPDYAASNAYVDAVFDAANPPPTPEQCATAEKVGPGADAYLRPTDRDYLDDLRARCAAMRTPRPAMQIRTRR